MCGVLGQVVSHDYCYIMGRLSVFGFGLDWVKENGPTANSGTTVITPPLF